MGNLQAISHDGFQRGDELGRSLQVFEHQRRECQRKILMQGPSQRKRNVSGVGITGRDGQDILGRTGRAIISGVERNWVRQRRGVVILEEQVLGDEINCIDSEYLE